MKWGILATGTIARKFAQTICQMNGETLFAVGSRNVESAHTFQSEFDVRRAYYSYEALAADPDVDAVYIATPNTLHYENCKLCLKHGKHVLCEKPFTINPDQAQELYALAADRGLFIMEALWTRMLPMYARLRSVIDSGVIGPLRRITVQYGFIAEGTRKDRKFNSALGGGALLDIGIYNLGFLQFVAGNPDKISTEEVHINEYGTDDYSRLCLAYSGGMEAISVQTIGTVLERKATIVGTKGEICLPDFQFAERMVVNGEETAMPFPINGFEYEIMEARRCIREGRCYSSIYTPEDSIALMRQLYDIRMNWGMKFEGEGIKTKGGCGDA